MLVERDGWEERDAGEEGEEEGVPPQLPEFVEEGQGVGVGNTPELEEEGEGVWE